MKWNDKKFEKFYEEHHLNYSFRDRIGFDRKSFETISLDLDLDLDRFNNISISNPKKRFNKLFDRNRWNTQFTN